MPEIRSVVNTGSRYLDVLFCARNYSSINPASELLHVLKKAVATKWLSETTVVVRDIRQNYLKKELNIYDL